MSNYSDEFKEAMVTKLTTPGAISAGSLSLEVGVAQSTLSRWIREYAMVGKAGVIMKAKRPQDWTVEEKLQAILDYENLDEETQGKYLREKGLHSINIQRWKQEFIEAYASKKKKDRVADPHQKRIKELERELNRKDKALAETAALLVLKKKAQAIWGDPGDER